MCELSGCSEEVADKGKSVESAGGGRGGGGGRRRRVKLATIIMKHKKEKNKEKSKKKSGSSRASSILTTMQRHHQQSSQGVGGGGTGSSTGAASSAATLLDQAALQSAYRWEKLSPAEFEQLQDLAACKEFFFLYFIYFIKNIFPNVAISFFFCLLKNNRVMISGLREFDSLRKFFCCVFSSVIILAYANSSSRSGWNEFYFSDELEGKKK